MAFHCSPHETCLSSVNCTSENGLKRKSGTLRDLETLLMETCHMNNVPHLLLQYTHSTAFIYLLCDVSVHVQGQLSESTLFGIRLQWDIWIVVLSLFCACNALNKALITRYNVAAVLVLCVLTARVSVDYKISGIGGDWKRVKCY
ncbi:hypothetical protein PHYPO_G00248940 [Pangasianodon hypophthalmus]|uniref:Uncharacterized protein n=1 Tax=Pangasianodon hypophthalmus TaxID=310915 RepID=A0A5N5JAJ1_PANHP|nr:hypothetical protein PHYPO_G00248940 [Pangasianodon hypophthalmus]